MFGTRQASLAVAFLLTVGSAQVAHADPPPQQANTDGSTARAKWVTFGVVTGLAGASLISSVSFNHSTGSDAGGCIFGDVTYASGCKNQYTKEAVGFLVAGSVLGAVALGIGFGWKTSKPAPKQVVVVPPTSPVNSPEDPPKDPLVLPPPPVDPVDSQVNPPTMPSVALTPPEGSRTPGTTGTVESTPPAAAGSKPAALSPPPVGEPSHRTMSPNPRGDKTGDKLKTVKGREMRPAVPTGAGTNVPPRKKCESKSLQPFIDFKVKLKDNSKQFINCLKLLDDAFETQLDQSCNKGLVDEKSISDTFPPRLDPKFTDEQCVKRAQSFFLKNPK